MLCNIIFVMFIVILYGELSHAQVQRPSDPNPFRQEHRALHRFKDHQIQTCSDRSTEPCTGSKTIRSKPVQTGAPSHAQVQRPSDPNPFRQEHQALHRFKDHQIQTHSDRSTEPCTGSKTIRSKPVQTGAPSLPQVQRSSDPNPFRQGNRTGSSDLGQGDVCCLSPFNNALNSIASRWQQLCIHYLVAVIKMDGCQLLHELELDTNVLKSFMLGHIL